MKLVDLLEHARKLQGTHAGRGMAAEAIANRDTQGIDYFDDRVLDSLAGLRYDSLDAELNADIDAGLRWARQYNEAVGA